MDLDYVKEAFVLVAIVALSFVLWAWLISEVRCKHCGHWRSHAETRRRLHWGTDMGGILRTDPFVVCMKVQVCDTCAQTRIKSTRSEPISEHGDLAIALYSDHGKDSEEARRLLDTTGLALDLVEAGVKPGSGFEDDEIYPTAVHQGCVYKGLERIKSLYQFISAKKARLAH